MPSALEIGCRVLTSRKLKLEDDPEGQNLDWAACRLAIPHVSAIYRALVAHGFELVSETDRRAGLFDGPSKRID